MALLKNAGRQWSVGFRSLVRRKQVDSIYIRGGGSQLAKRLTVRDLVAIGAGATIGAGVYILIGTVAKEDTGPALTLSFLIAGIAAALSAFCYAELACRCPSAGSAYHYSYICVGEGVAWLIGWALILEYTVGGAAVARGISPNLALYFGGEDNLPSVLARHTLFGVTVDPCAAMLVFVVTILLSMGVKESTSVQSVVTVLNVCCLMFIIIAGGYLAVKTGWAGYDLSDGYFPYGLKGVLAGSATVFYSFIGFDTVASTAEEVKNPQRDLPLGIGLALSLCCGLYMSVSVVIVGLVPYSDLNVDTPISSAFSDKGMEWAAYVVATGAVMALCATLLGNLLPQPRILMAMARDGLLPPLFSDINKRTQVPVKSTVATGFLAAGLAFSMEVSQLAGMVSVGTLMAFTIVAVSVLILRYVPPDETPMPSSFRESIASFFEGSHHNNAAQDDSDVDVDNDSFFVADSEHERLLGKVEPLEIKFTQTDNTTTSDSKKRLRRRKVAAWNITVVCISVLTLAFAASAGDIPSYAQIVLCGTAGAVFIGGVLFLGSTEQDAARHNFGYSGGFSCPFVPYLPIACILVNTYLLINIGVGTWIRVSIWLLIGVLVYLFYGRTHSSLQDAVYVPAAMADEIYRSSSEWSCPSPSMSPSPSRAHF